MVWYPGVWQFCRSFLPPLLSFDGDSYRGRENSYTRALQPRSKLLTLDLAGARQRVGLVRLRVRASAGGERGAYNIVVSLIYRYMCEIRSCRTAAL